MATVSVVVCAYNAAPFIDAAIGSVLDQTFSDFELIVVNDGSSDGTAERIDAWTDARLRAIHQANEGAAGCLNTGLRAARGEYVALLDGDDVWRRDKLSVHMEAFERHPEADLTFSWSDWIDEAGRATGLHSRRCRGWFGFHDLVEDFVIGNTSSAVLRRSAVDRVGLCDPRFHRYYDMDLFLRVARLRRRNVLAIPRSLTFYRRHDGQMSRDWQAMREEWNLLAAEMHATGGADGEIIARGSSNMARYFAYLAYESGKHGEAGRILLESLSARPGLFLRDRRNWRMSAAACAGLLLPSGILEKLKQAARRIS